MVSDISIRIYIVICYDMLKDNELLENIWKNLFVNFLFFFFLEILII